MGSYCLCIILGGEKGYPVSIYRDCYKCLFAIISVMAFFSLPFAARPAFYNYVIIMFILNAIALFACGLTGNGAGFAFWLASSKTWHNSFEPSSTASFSKACFYFFLQVLSHYRCVLPCLLSSTAVYYISGRLFPGYNVLYLMQNAVLFVVDSLADCSFDFRRKIFTWRMCITLKWKMLVSSNPIGSDVVSSFNCKIRLISPQYINCRT